MEELLAFTKKCEFSIVKDLFDTFNAPYEISEEVQNKALRIVNTGKRTIPLGLQALPAGSLFATAQLPPHTYPYRLHSSVYL